MSRLTRRSGGGEETCGDKRVPPRVWTGYAGGCGLIRLRATIQNTLSISTARSVVIMANMKAARLVRTRIIYAENAFAELVLWKVSAPVSGSRHNLKYRLAYAVDGIRVLRYDNEVGKGDHRHYGGTESNCQFTTSEALIADFQRDIARWNRENRHSGRSRSN